MKIYQRFSNWWSTSSFKRHFFSFDKPEGRDEAMCSGEEEQVFQSRNVKISLSSKSIVTSSKLPFLPTPPSFSLMFIETNNIIVILWTLLMLRIDIYIYRDRGSILIWPTYQFDQDELNSEVTKFYCIKIDFLIGFQNVLM